jgi:hypothetical protein
MKLSLLTLISAICAVQAAGKPTSNPGKKN